MGSVGLFVGNDLLWLGDRVFATAFAFSASVDHGHWQLAGRLCGAGVTGRMVLAKAMAGQFGLVGFVGGRRHVHRTGLFAVLPIDCQNRWRTDLDGDLFDSVGRQCHRGVVVE